MTTTNAPDRETEHAVAANLAAVKDTIATAAEAAGRRARDVTLVAVSKSQPSDRVRAALLAGQRVFGENRIQEATERWAVLKPEFPDAQLHFIGHLQSNKASEAVGLFDVIQSIDRPKIARVVAEEVRRQGRSVTCLIQVNTGEESQKGGIPPNDVERLVEACRDEFVLPIAGLMCIPPVDEEPSPHFMLLAELADRLGLRTVSMGMSGDYDIAVRLGATHVRVGTAIFGAREPRRQLS